MKTFAYKDLPEFVRRPLLEYHRSGGTDPREWRWSWRRIPLKDLAKELWRNSGGMREDFGSFQEYHEWYVKKMGIPVWARKEADSLWAILLDGPPGGPYEESVIEDGWHRFHYYLDRHGASFEAPVTWAVRRVEDE